MSRFSELFNSPAEAPVEVQETPKVEEKKVTAEKPKTTKKK